LELCLLRLRLLSVCLAPQWFYDTFHFSFSRERGPLTVLCSRHLALPRSLRESQRGNGQRGRTRPYAYFCRPAKPALSRRFHQGDYEVYLPIPYARKVMVWRAFWCRWRLVTPTVIAHSSIQDYTYKGMFIPKDTAIYPNGT
jgi:hypothetical protein